MTAAARGAGAEACDGAMMLRLHSVVFLAPGISLFELRAPAGAPLPPFAPGAHIDVTLADGLVRSYSLVGPPEDRGRYLVAVKHERHGRGGSRHLHERLRVGDLVAVSVPRNSFPLHDGPAPAVLIAGGIGITPILSMARALHAAARPFVLHYAARARAQAAFLPELAGFGEAVHLHFDEESGDRTRPVAIDVGAAVRAAAPEAHLYCCGPAPMMEAFAAATEGWPPARVHTEYFSSDVAPADEGGFEVVLARTGGSVTVQPGQTILDALLAKGLDLPFSCMEGICGSCETAVLEGVPDHRDLSLTAEEKAANRTMMICCSGAKSPRLVLDL